MCVYTLPGGESYLPDALSPPRRPTNVVNELDIPILCMGCKNMVVAASCDGILVSDKVRSGYMKPYVERLSDEAQSKLILSRLAYLSTKSR